MMSALGGIFVLVYFCAIIALSIYLLELLTKFVRSHDRIASALERIAQNPPRANP